MAGFVAFRLQQVVGRSAVEMSSELIDRIDVVSFAWPLRTARLVGICSVFDDASFVDSPLPFHMVKRHAFSFSSLEVCVCVCARRALVSWKLPEFVVFLRLHSSIAPILRMPKLSPGT